MNTSIAEKLKTVLQGEARDLVDPFVEISFCGQKVLVVVIVVVAAATAAAAAAAAAATTATSTTIVPHKQSSYR